MLLSSLPVSTRCRVTGIQAHPRASRRLAAFGLLPGCLIQILRSGKSALVIEIRGSFLALSRELAAGIIVAREEDAYER